MSDLLKQGQSLLSSVSGGNTSSSSDNTASSGQQQSSSGTTTQSSGQSSFIAKGVNAVEDRLGFDKDHKYDQYEQKGIDLLQKQLKK
ncbi:hypothetical protein DV735_g432, partial [Chaetothyriales sp. CBS 134920]